MISVSQKVHFVTRDRRKRITKEVPEPTEIPTGRIPRVSKLMALAIRFDELIREGKVQDMSELARLAHVTQPRMTQIMNLLHLAPEIQEELMFLPCVVSGRDPIHEKTVRPICAEQDWREQREMWQALRRQHLDLIQFSKC